jgi:hypothetical protein
MIILRSENLISRSAHHKRISAETAETPAAKRTLAQIEEIITQGNRALISAYDTAT